MAAQRPNLLTGKAIVRQENDFGASLCYIEQGNCIVMHPLDHSTVSCYRIADEHCLSTTKNIMCFFLLF